jgi:catechol-2,3-dioxygenase
MVGDRRAGRAEQPTPARRLLDLNRGSCCWLAVSITEEGHSVRITRVDITSEDVDVAAAFYAGVLDQPVEVAADSVTVKIGASTVVLRPRPAGTGINHMAFTIPANRFAEAKAWLSGRVSLLGKDGADEFPLGGAWNSESVYFPARTVPSWS